MEIEKDGVDISLLTSTTVSAHETQCECLDFSLATITTITVNCKAEAVPNIFSSSQDCSHSTI